MSNCQFCHKVLSKEKGEEDHGCLDCAGYLYIVNGVTVCFHCVEKDNRRLREENHIMRQALASIGTSYERPTEMMVKARETIRTLKDLGGKDDTDL